MDETDTPADAGLYAEIASKEMPSDGLEDAKELPEDDSEQGSELSGYNSEEGRRSDEEFEMGLEEAFFEDDGYFRSDMDSRIQELGITPAFWEQRERNKKMAPFRLTRFLEKFARRNAKHADKPPLHIPVDIATCIMHELPDLDTLGDAILINKSFATSFNASSKSIIRSVIFNRFGESSFDYALMLGVLCHANSKGSLKDRDGKIPLVPPSPETPLERSVITGINMICLTVMTWIDLWEKRNIWVEKGNRKWNVDRLSRNSKVRFVRAILLFWVYADCARNTLEQAQSQFSGSKFTLQGTRILENFSHFELLEARAIFQFFYKLVRIACNDWCMQNTENLGRWQSYCLSLGPMWVLKLLEYYELGFETTGYEGEDEGFFLYHVEEELEIRGIGGLSAGFSDQEHEALVQALKKRGIDGNSRPTGEK